MSIEYLPSVPLIKFQVSLSGIRQTLYTSAIGSAGQTHRKILSYSEASIFEISLQLNTTLFGTCCLQNKALRDQLEEKDKILEQREHQMALQQQHIADLQKEAASWKAGKLKKKPDRAVQAEVRRNYKLLFSKGKADYDLDLRFDCLYNRKATDRVVEGVHGTLGHSYTDEEIVRCCHTYFTSMRADRRRKLNGNLDKHRKRSGRTIRLSRKREKRQEIIESDSPPPLTLEQMAQAKDMISAGTAYMSSDESDTEDGDGYNRVRKVRRLAWESKQMADIKDIVDRHGYQCANKKQKAKMVLLKRDSSCDISSRPVPQNILNWAVDVFYSENVEQ